MKLVTRRQWGARSPRSQASYLASTRGVKVHYTGSFVDPRLKDDHGRCAAMARQIQNGHMDGNGWNDVGYSFLVCPHRYVFEGRGLHRLPAANGPGLNTGHYAVLGMVGNKGLVTPTDDMLHGIRDAIEYVRANGGAGREIKGHRDGYSTDCPGARLYAWVKQGAPRPKGGAEPVPDKPPAEPEDVLEILLNLGIKGALTIAPGERVSVPWDAEYADPSHMHGSGPAWTPKVKDWALVTLGAVVDGQGAGEKLKLAFAEYEKSGAARVKDVFGEDKIGNGTKVEYTLSGVMWLSSDRSYRVDLVNQGSGAVTVTGARLRVAR
ncbi:peptidoglycan recognition family protein [Actinocorallia sp. B10E7]|uniref:peptidoglycan recognition protein family protein n=1 Tax=Actinocorallia sp. B10E7 TaxID=3153558 RepID=UPI00325CB24C